MAKVWVLDTETKGTCAEMVPLEKVLERKRSAPDGGRASVLRRRRDPGADTAGAAGPPPAEREPPRFRLVNVITRQVLGEDLRPAELLDLLGDVPSIVDVHIFVRDRDSGDWRPLTFAEKKVAWGRSRP